MTTLDVKSADAATLVDDIAATLDATTNWSNADTWVENTGAAKDDVSVGGKWDPSAEYARSDDTDGDGMFGWYSNDNNSNEWFNNGYVYHNSQLNGGYYLTFYVDVNGEVNNEHSGILFYYSEGWDSTHHVPTGKCQMAYRDYYSGFADGAPFTENNGTGAFVVSLFDTYYDNERVQRADTCEYLISAQTDGTFICAGWKNDMADPNNNEHSGAAGWVGIGPTSAKMWPDGNEPWVMINNRTNARSGTDTSCQYGWAITSDGGSRGGAVGRGNSAVGQCKWGLLNPSPQDDTFIYDEPVVYKSGNQEIPVATIPWVLPADKWGGPSTGDTVTVGTDTYKFVCEKGSENESRNYNRCMAGGFLFQ